MEGVLLSGSRKPFEVPFDRGMVYVFNFLPHNAIKLLDESPEIEIYIRTSYLCEDKSFNLTNLVCIIIIIPYYASLKLRLIYSLQEL